jgi:hypothetical protein
MPWQGSEAFEQMIGAEPVPRPRASAASGEAEQPGHLSNLLSRLVKGRRSDLPRV